MRRDPLFFVSGTLVAEVYLKNLLFHTNVTGKHHEKLLIALAGAACLFTQITAAKADQLQDIEKRGVIRIAVPQDFPPFGSVGTDLQPQGYDIDMARYLASQMKLKLQLVPVTSANRVPYLQTDKVDLVISSLGKMRSARR